MPAPLSAADRPPAWAAHDERSPAPVQRLMRRSTADLPPDWVQHDGPPSARVHRLPRRSPADRPPEWAAEGARRATHRNGPPT
jgi:hypothetical protein